LRRSFHDRLETIPSQDVFLDHRAFRVPCGGFETALARLLNQRTAGG
jgi:hypothetical protein